jgi:hypothetical protein
MSLVGMKYGFRPVFIANKRFSVKPKANTLGYEAKLDIFQIS